MIWAPGDTSAVEHPLNALSSSPAATHEETILDLVIICGTNVYSTVFHLKHSPPLRAGRRAGGGDRDRPGSFGLVAR